jgi:chromosome segregation ATPase
MASTTMPLDQVLADKLASVEISVAEIKPESPHIEMEQLTMQSPLYSLTPVNVIRCPPSNAGQLRPSSPTGSVRSSFSSSHRRISRRSHSHYCSSFSRSHRSEVSKELTSQAESKFHALIELMSGILRCSTSLREVWTKIISEQESYVYEIDRLCSQVDEFTEIIERHESEKHSYSHEHEERKKEVARLHLELQLAVSNTTELEKKLYHRDCELGKSCSEVAELKDVYKYLKEEHEETKTTLEETQTKLIASEQACCFAEEDAKKHHSDLETLGLRYAELQSSYIETITTLESTRKEVIALKQLILTYKKEQHE